MIPIRSSNPTGATPYVTVILIAANTVVFVLGLLGNAQEMTYRYGYVPAELVESPEGFAEGLRRHPPVRQRTDQYGRPLGDFFGRPLVAPDIEAIKAAEAVPAWINLFTCMFLHGGWMHLIGNMLYLWIFGTNIEDRLGKWLFLVFYLGTGVVGSLMHTVFQAGYVPLVGASGAISGVMGAYILLFPRTRILAVAPIGWYPLTVSLPAWTFLGIYFVIQNLYPAYFGAGDNVAYWAHIGGFLSGAALIFIFPKRRGHVAALPAYDPHDDDADVVI
jgi:membrane associated rhomboid family serine protease